MMETLRLPMFKTYDEMLEAKARLDADRAAKLKVLEEHGLVSLMEAALPMLPASIQQPLHDCLLAIHEAARAEGWEA